MRSMIHDARAAVTTPTRLIPPIMSSTASCRRRWRTSLLDAFRAVAERAGVSERTVYRNFPSERQVHDAIMARLEDEAGISYEDVELDNLADVTARVFASLRRFTINHTMGTPHGPAFAGAGARRHDALHRAVAARAPDLPATQRRALAGLLDVLWSPPTYERLIGAWNLDDAEAIGAVQWLIAKVIAAVENNEPPTITA
jgi:AcrR family transcriptional regulator